MKKNLAFLLTLYKPTKDDLDYWSNIANELVFIGYEFFVLLDNPEIKGLIDNKFDVKVFCNNENKGKFKTVYDFVKTGLIKTSHFKTIDPDDRFDFEQLKDFEIKPDWEDSILNLECNYNKAGIITKTRRNNFGSSYTIIPTKSILVDNMYEEDYGVLNWIEDQFLGIISFGNCGKFIEINWSWYQYIINEKSMTNNYLNDDDFNEIYNSIKSFVRITKKIKKKPVINFPGKLKYISELIMDSKYINNKEIKVKSLMDLLKNKGV